MLNASKDRLDYGAQLTPPDGFELDAAVATSYTLDLNALLAVPIALCFANTLEGDLKGEKLALLEAISQLHGKLKVFYQKGKIHNPNSYNRLYALLEPCLQAIVPDGGVFSSFHPKLWLLRFKQTGVAERSAKIQYRLLVLSRNLTFDRSWDLALCLDGELNEAFATWMADKASEHFNPQWNLKLRERLWKELKPGTRVISYVHDMGDWKPDEVVRVQGAFGERNLYLWRIAPAGGR